MHCDNALLPPTIHLGYLTDDVLIAHVSRASESLRFVGPGMSLEAAKAFVTCWRRLPPDAVELILDAEADLCRLGFGDGEALAILLAAAQQFGVQVHRQPGLRLCVLDVDGERIIFPSAPRLVEAPGRESSHIILAPGQGEPLHDTILAPQETAPRPLTPATVAKVQQELRESPAQPFDLARQVRVLSTNFQFVEFSIQSAALSRKRVPVPPDLLGLSIDSDTEELLRANFQLFGKSDEISGEKLIKRRDEIDKAYLVTIAHFGKVIRRNNRADFDKEVEALKADVRAFQAGAKEKLDAAISKNCAEVIARLLPAVKRNLPERWRASLGPKPSEEMVARRLERELKSAYGDASDYLKRIEVRLVHKDITVEMLRDEEFAKAAAKADLFLDEMYEEYQAAKARA